MRLIAVIVIVGCVCDSIQIAHADEKPARPQSGGPKGQAKATSGGAKITLSVATTRILEPLDEDGYVDYLGALNRMASAGVTPENNAAVLFARAWERKRGHSTFQLEKQNIPLCSNQRRNVTAHSDSGQGLHTLAVRALNQRLTSSQ